MVAAAHTAGRLTSYYENLTGRLDANRLPVPPAVTARYNQLRRQPTSAD
jgi:hypothetical protein